MGSILETRVGKIGQSLVECRRSCRGIVCDQERGQIPRCLFLQTDDRQRSGAKGAVVVGLNPGRSSKKEQQHYQKGRCTYESIIRWYKESGSKSGLNHLYHRRLLMLLNASELNGPILWTELVKCESRKHQKGPLDLQTLRTCTGKFLCREIKQVPRSWAIFGVGREAYEALAYLFPGRTVIGVPHPTGSWGRWLGGKNGRLPEAVAARTKDALGETGQAVWLPDSLRIRKAGQD